MTEPSLIVVAISVFGAIVMLLIGLYLLAKFHRLFRKQIGNELLRRNIVVWMVAICITLSLTPTRGEFYQGFMQGKLVSFFVTQILAVTVETLFVFNIAWIVVQYLDRKNASFRKKMILALITIIAGCMAIAVPLNYFISGEQLKNVGYTIVYNFYTGCMTGLIYVTMSYVDLERKRKLSEKELEVAKLQGLKNKAELDALHSKINPHFLYNALNSIADLAITDGKKARKMTIALADLFRYSINYSDHNYSTVRDEVEMTGVYLSIEKIRFEDKLVYTIDVDPELEHYLIPRFILQPVVENAVKHGLKATGIQSEIRIEVKAAETGLRLTVSDNGPAFPTDLIPGYGVKSIYDKLELLFHGNYEVHFINEPRKQVSIFINKLMKDEPSL